MREPLLLDFRKRHRQYIKSIFGGQFVHQSFAITKMAGDFVLKPSVPRMITGRYIDAVRRAFIRKSSRLVHFWYRVHLHSMFTQKPKEMRMGKGKGSLARWEAPLSSGHFLFFLSFHYYFLLDFVFFIFNSLRSKLGVPPWFSYKFFFPRYRFRSVRLFG